MHPSAIFRLLVVAISITTASSAENDPEFKARGNLSRQHASAGRSGSTLGLRALLALDSRQSDDECVSCSNKPGWCCRDGKSCCDNNEYCVLPGGECCTDEDGTCLPGEQCCKEGCSPDGTVCCLGGGYCESGWICEGETQCRRGGGDDDDDDDDDDDEDEDEDEDGTLSTSRPIPEPTTSTEVEFTDYTFTHTWFYFSYYYITQLETITLTSTEYTTSTLIVVEATNAADAKREYGSVTETMSVQTSMEPTVTPSDPPTTPAETAEPGQTEEPEPGTGSAVAVVPRTGGLVGAVVGAIVMGTAGLAFML